MLNKQKKHKKSKMQNKKINNKKPVSFSVSVDYEGNPPELKFEEAKKAIPIKGKRPEYAGEDNFTGGGQNEASPTGPGSKTAFDPGQSPQDESYTAHAEERPEGRETNLPKDKILSNIDERTGRPGKRRKPRCKADQSCPSDNANE